MSNGIRTAALMAAMIVLFALVGQALGGQTGMIIALIFALGTNFFSYWKSDKIVLRMYKAQEVQRAQAPELYDMVDRLRVNAGLPMPKVYVIPSDQPNAFATGRNPDNSAVAVTNGIVRLLSKSELEGVIAHELAHIKNRDILTSTLSAVLASAITLIAQFGIFFGGSDDEGVSPITAILMLILAPIAAALIQMAISRSREYAADRDGAAIARNPQGLAGALRKIEHYAQGIAMPQAREATAHMFIVNPFAGGAKATMARLFATHPPTEERIARLEQLR